MSKITGAERVYQAVLTDIQSEVLHPGDPLREDVLAQRYGVSRTPVREALRRLIQDGLCEKHGASLRIRRPTLEQVHEIYPVVAVLEGLAARLCAEGIDTATLRRLDALQASMAHWSHIDGHAGYARTNQEFHDVILAASRNDTLVATVRRLRLITLALRRYQLGIGHRMRRSLAEHEDLLDAIRAHDGPAAEAAMRRHVDAGHRLLVDALSPTPLFEPHVDSQEQPMSRDPTGHPTTPSQPHRPRHKEKS